MSARLIDTVGNISLYQYGSRLGPRLELVQNRDKIYFDKREDVACLLMSLLRWYFTTEE